GAAADLVGEEVHGRRGGQRCRDLGRGRREAGGGLGGGEVGVEGVLDDGDAVAHPREATASRSAAGRPASSTTSPSSSPPQSRTPTCRTSRTKATAPRFSGWTATTSRRTPSSG